MRGLCVGLVVSLLIWGGGVGQAAVQQWEDRAALLASLPAVPVVTIDFEGFVPMDVADPFGQAPLLCLPHQPLCGVDLGWFTIETSRPFFRAGGLEANLVVVPAEAFENIPSQGLLTLGGLDAVGDVAVTGLTGHVFGVDVSGPDDVLVEVTEADSTVTLVTCRGNGAVFPEQAPAFCGLTSPVGLTRLAFGGTGGPTAVVLDNILVENTPGPFPRPVSLLVHAAWKRQRLFGSVAQRAAETLQTYTNWVATAHRRVTQAENLVALRQQQYNAKPTAARLQALHLAEQQLAAANTHLLTATRQQEAQTATAGGAQAQAAAATLTWETLRDE